MKRWLLEFPFLCNSDHFSVSVSFAGNLRNLALRFQAVEASDCRFRAGVWPSSSLRHPGSS